MSGCAYLLPWTALPEGRYVDRARGFSSSLPKDWMRYNMSTFFLITKDGTVLESIRVERMRFEEELKFTKKGFRQDMLPQDLAELEIDNLKANDNIRQVTITMNEPALIDGEQGFKIGYEVVTSGGLPVKGIRYGLISGGYVYRIKYEAAAQHYYERHLKHFKAFISDFQFLR